MAAPEYNPECASCSRRKRLQDVWEKIVSTCTHTAPGGGVCIGCVYRVLKEEIYEDDLPF